VPPHSVEIIQAVSSTVQSHTTLRHHPKRLLLDGTDDGGGISDSSSALTPADPKSHTPVKVDILLDQKLPVTVQNPMVDLAF